MTFKIFVCLVLLYYGLFLFMVTFEMFPRQWVWPRTLRQRAQRGGLWKTKAFAIFLIALSFCQLVRLMT